MEEGILSPSKQIEKTITHHDPCYLGKRNEVYDAPRAIISKIPGLNLVEMRDNKVDSLCCGGGGVSSFRCLVVKGKERDNFGKVKALDSVQCAPRILHRPSPGRKSNLYPGSCTVDCMGFWLGLAVEWVFWAEFGTLVVLVVI